MSTKRKPEGHSKGANRPHILKSGDSGSYSERDSGFSDASSEHMSTMDTTDSEDSTQLAVKQAPQTSGARPKPSPLTVVGGSYSSLSPMIIMNNVLLKQPGDSSPALKPWGFSPTVEVVQPVVHPVVQQPQVVFLQPVVSHQASSASKEATSRHRRPKKFLPILKSYPKIAPHPGDSSSSSGRGTGSLSSSSSSAGSDKGSSLTSNNLEQCQKVKQPSSSSGKSAPATTSLPIKPSITSPLLQSRLSLPTPETNASSSPANERPSSAVSQSEFTTSPFFTYNSDFKNQTLPVSQVVSQENTSLGDQDHSDAETKRKRFCNTYNILSKSGLLDITLRTKELLRQNRRTQNDLDRLKEHTDLFLQALRSGDTCVFVKLQARLQEEEREKERATQSSLTAD